MTWESGEPGAPDKPNGTGMVRLGQREWAERSLAGVSAFFVPSKQIGPGTYRVGGFRPIPTGGGDPGRFHRGQPGSRVSTITRA
jgi:hypothetical protein